MFAFKDKKGNTKRVLPWIYTVHLLLIVLLHRFSTAYLLLVLEFFIVTEMSWSLHWFPFEDSIKESLKRKHFPLFTFRGLFTRKQNVPALVSGDNGMLSHTVRLKSRGLACNCARFLYNHIWGYSSTFLAKKKSISRYPLSWSVCNEMCLLSFQTPWLSMLLLNW